MGKRAHVFKNSHRRCAVGAFDKSLHEGYIWTSHRAVLSFILHKSIFIHFVHHGKTFYDRFICSDARKKGVLDDGSGVKSEQKFRKLYYSKYLETCVHINYVLSIYYIKHMRIRQTYSGIKRKATGFCILYVHHIVIL